MMSSVMDIRLTNLVVMFSDIKRPLILKCKNKLRLKRIKELKVKRRSKLKHQYKKAKIGMIAAIDKYYRVHEPKEEEEVEEKKEELPIIQAELEGAEAPPRPKSKKKKKKKKKRVNNVSLTDDIQ